MTPEALHTYIVGRGFTEDVAQDVVVAYLISKRVIRDPQAWGVRVALHLTARYAKGPSPSWGRVSSLQAPLFDHSLVGQEPDPLRCAIAKDELTRLKPPKCKPGWAGYHQAKGLEDYALYIRAKGASSSNDIT